MISTSDTLTNTTANQFILLQSYIMISSLNDIIVKNEYQTLA